MVVENRGIICHDEWAMTSGVRKVWPTVSASQEGATRTKKSKKILTSTSLRSDVMLWAQNEDY